MAKSKKKKTSFVKKWFVRLIVLSIILFAISLSIYIYFLDKQIREYLDFAAPSQPNHVYARPQIFSANSNISVDDFISILNRKSYKRVKQIRQPGDYAASKQIVDVYLHATPFSKPEFTAQPLRVEFKEDKILRITSHENSANISEFAFQPEFIGSLKLGEYQDRIFYQLHEAPVMLLATLLAMEDRAFYQHYGVSPKGILRALWKNITKQGGLQGGSTLTQQLVKNLFLTSERSYERKIKEALMAFVLEYRYSKAQILTWYINEIFLGQSGNRAIHGFALASEYYFGRPLHELDVHEIALLVGMIPAPSYYNPISHPERALQRRNLVLKTLVKLNILSQEEALAASKRKVLIKAKSLAKSDRFPAFFEFLDRQLNQYFSKSQLQAGGLKLYTSLNSHIQRVAQRALSKNLVTLEKNKKLPKDSLQGAVIIIEPSSGDVLAMVGDRKANFVGFNRALDANRPIGSLVKPFIYLSAIEDANNYSLATIIKDTPLRLSQAGSDDWSPQNYDKKYVGNISLYRALTNSRNIPSIRIGMDIGLSEIKSTLRRLGLSKDIRLTPASLLGSISLSPLEVTQLYQPLANYGVIKPILPIIKIHDVYNKPITRFSASDKHVISTQNAYLLNYALHQVTQIGTARKIKQTFGDDYYFAGKTGTTNNYRDSWFVGYNQQYLALIWIGRDNNKPTKLSGASGALNVWIDIMKQLPLSPYQPKAPSNIKTVLIDNETGLLANKKCPNRAYIPFHSQYTPTKFSPCAGIMSQIQNWFGANNNGSSTETNQQNKQHNPNDVIIEDRSR